MYCLKLSKYGNELKKSSSWTSVSDIGHSFDGIVLTESLYLQYEDEFVSVLVGALTECSISTVTVSELEDKRDKEFERILRPKDRDIYDMKITEGQKFRVEEVENLIRLSLREDIWCKLSFPEGYIHFGYDFYVYLGVPKVIENKGLKLLTAMPVSSPYM